MNVSGPESMTRSIEMLNNLTKTIADKTQETDKKMLQVAVSEQVQKTSSENQVDLLA